MFFWRKHKRLITEIEAYRTKLATSPVPVDVNETIGCHAAMLILSDNTEQRVRSIQTLAQLGAATAVPAAVNELVSLSKKWLQKDVNDWAKLLLGVLRHTRFEYDLRG